MTNKIPWSFSRLKDFEQCPRKFQGKYITKEFGGADFEVYHLKRGKMIHNALENYLKTGDVKLLSDKTNPDLIYQGTELSKVGKSVLKVPLDFLVPMLEKLRASEGLDVETQKAFNTQFEPVSWFGRGGAVWFRIVMDVKAFSNPHTLVILDWKSGKTFGDVDQLKMAAGVGMKMHIQVDHVIVAYVFVDHPEAPPLIAEYTRDDIDDIWQEFGDRAEMIQLCVESGVWEPKPSNFNCTYCEATPHQCEYKKD